MIDTETKIMKDFRIISNLIKRKLASNSIASGLPIPCLNKKNNRLTPMQGMFVGYIYEHRVQGDVFQKDLETNFSIRRSTATEILKLMEKNGLIIKEAVENDKRLKKLILTEKAEREHRLIIETVDKVDIDMIKGFSDSEIEDLHRLLEKLKKNLE